MILDNDGDDDDDGGGGDGDDSDVIIMVMILFWRRLIATQFGTYLQNDTRKKPGVFLLQNSSIDYNLYANYMCRSKFWLIM